MSSLLARYTAWLAAQAPETAAAARPPAPDADIAAAEQELEADFPASIRQLYQWHDGGPDHPALWLTDDFGFLPLDAARDARRMKREIAEEKFEPADVDWYWDRHWFPIGTSWTGDFLVVDCSTRRTRGQVSVAGNEGPVVSNPVWTDLDTLLGELVDALENRTPWSGYVPVTRDGCLSWEEAA